LKLNPEIRSRNANEQRSLCLAMLRAALHMRGR
jgi:hypothetical protein